MHIFTLKQGLHGFIIAALALSFGIGLSPAQAKSGVPCVKNRARTCAVFVVAPSSGKDRAVFKVYDETGSLVGSTTPYKLYKGQLIIRRGDTDGDGKLEFVTVPGDSGVNVSVKVWSVDTTVFSINREATIAVGDGTFNEGARLVVADLDGDGQDEIVVSVRASGNDTIYAYQHDAASGRYVQIDSFTAGSASVALQAGDFNADGAEEIVVSPTSTAGAVDAYTWNGTDLTLQESFFPFGENFAGGVRVRAGNVLGDAQAELVITRRAGVDSTVSIYGWNGSTYAKLTSFLAYGDAIDRLNIKTGVALRLGNIAGDAHLEIVTAPWQNGKVPLRVWQAGSDGTFRVIGRHFLYPAAIRGLNLATYDVAPDRIGDGHEEIIVAPRGRGGPILMVLRYNPNASGNLEIIRQLAVFHPSFRAEVQLDADAD